MTGPWVLGELFNFFWTVSDAGDDTEFNYFVTQPFVNYNFEEGWALAFVPIITDSAREHSSQSTVARSAVRATSSRRRATIATSVKRV